MRYKYLRSMLRTAVAVGLITCGQGPLQAFGLGELTKPHSGICFIHDLDWETFAGSNWKRADEQILASTAGSKNELEPMQILSESAPQLEKQQIDAIRAAKSAELQQQVQAVLNSIQHRANAWGTQAKQALISSTQLPARTRTAIASKSLQFADWIKASVAKPATQATDAPGRTSSFADDANYDWGSYDWANDNWDCSDWYSSFRKTSKSIFPVRDRANTFVYVFETTTAEPNSNPTVIANQGGMDPVCPEINSGASEFKWADIAEKPRVCCPVDQHMIDDAVASSQVVHLEGPGKPPTLESDLPDSSSEIAQVLVAAQSLYPSPSDLPHVDFPDSNSPNRDLLGIGHCQVESLHASRSEPTISELPDSHLVNSAQSNPTAEKDLYREWPMDYVSRFVGTELPYCNQPWLDKGYCMRSRTEPHSFFNEGESVVRYTREDLQFANRLSARIFNPAQIDCHTDFDSNTLREEYSQSTECSSETFGVADLSAPKPRISWGALLLPIAVSKCFELGDFSQTISLTPNHARSFSKIHVAKQIRTFGQLLIDFATRIETNEIRTEFATREADTQLQ